MHLNWRRGLFRSLLVLAVTGAGFAASQWGWETGSKLSENDCWSRIAKWPDGRPFSVFDLFEDVNTPRTVELNKEGRAWSTQSPQGSNPWVISTRQRLIACETGGAVMAQMTGQTNSVWVSLRNSLLGFLLPPFAILGAGWIARGLKPSKA